MRDRLSRLLSLDYRLVLVPDEEEGGYGAYYPDLPGCVSCGDTVEETLENAEDAKREWIMSMLEDGRDIPEPSEELGIESPKYRIMAGRKNVLMEM